MKGILFIYLIVINVIAFVTYGADKRRAIRHKWRIPEYVLILLALTGGGAGALAGMYFFCHKTRKWKFRILVPLSMILWISIAAFFFYAGDYYHAGKLAAGYMKSDRTVAVKKEGDGYLFDGPGADTLIIFYPGAKVEEEAYAPVLHQLAGKGVDCFLVRMPFRLAFLGMNKAEKVIGDHQGYKHFYMAGHSLGGAMAGNFAAEHKDEISGVILLAAYPTKSLKGTRVLSIYGSRDKVLNRDHYEKNISLMPDDLRQIIIKGGNHARFGDYGHQRGDGKAAITAEKQWSETVGAISSFLEG